MELVQRALGDARPIVSWINLVEVDYQLRRRHGAEQAATVLSELRDKIEAELPGVERMRQAAALKAVHPIALADCFAIATASAAATTLITGDPEIIERQADFDCPVVDARGLGLSYAAGISRRFSR